MARVKMTYCLQKNNDLPPNPYNKLTSKSYTIKFRFHYEALLYSLLLMDFVKSITTSTPDRLQLKSYYYRRLLETVFHCHLSPDWRKMAIEHTVSSDFGPRSSIVKSVFGCRLFDVTSTL